MRPLDALRITVGFLFRRCNKPLEFMDFRFYLSRFLALSFDSGIVLGFQGHLRIFRGASRKCSLRNDSVSVVNGVGVNYSFSESS